MTTLRITRNQCFMQIAFVVAKRSTCNRLRVGAVVVKENRIIATGYNGSPRGLPHCDLDSCNSEIDHCRATVHAELNALLFAGREAKDAVLYVTHNPCNACSLAIINAGISKVLYRVTYGSVIPQFDWMRKAGVGVFQR